MSDALAIQGGRPVRDDASPFPPWPLFEEDEIAAVERVLRSGEVNYWTGSEGLEFEREFAGFTGSGHALALANGTVALELALQTLDIGPGDEVIVPARTFIATASAVVARGARPVVVDVDRETQNLTAESLAAGVSEKTRAVIVVHLAGLPADMGSIIRAARARGILVIEDCAQALGATYEGRHVGTFGDAGAFSFCQDKIMTTGGEGGALVTDDEELWKRAWSYRDHGKDYDLCQGTGDGGGIEFKWLVERFGTNWRMTEIQSAIGRVALGKVPAWTGKRRANAALLDRGFADVPGLRVPDVPGDRAHSYYKYYAFVRPQELSAGWDRSKIAQAVRAEGIPCSSGSCPEIYREEAFARIGARPQERLEVARELGETSLMFQVHHTAGEGEMRDTVEAVRKVMKVAACR